MLDSGLTYAPRSIIDTSIELFRHATPDALLEDERPFLIRDGIPHAYRRRRFANLNTAFQSLAPFTLGRSARYLFLEGADGSYCAYANNDRGAAGSLTIAAHARIQFDSFGFVNQRPLEFFSRHQVQQALESRTICHSHFVLHYVRNESGINKHRTIRCSNFAHMRLDPSNSGDLLPFEEQRDYRCLKKGDAPTDEVLQRFVHHFGWPSPRTREFANFIRTIELYEYAYNDNSVLLPKSAEHELLSLPPEWESSSE